MDVWKDLIWFDYHTKYILKKTSFKKSKYITIVFEFFYINDKKWKQVEVL